MDLAASGSGEAGGPDAAPEIADDSPRGIVEKIGRSAAKFRRRAGLEPSAYAVHRSARIGAAAVRAISVTVSGEAETVDRALKVA